MNNFGRGTALWVISGSSILALAACSGGESEQTQQLPVSHEQAATDATSNTKTMLVNAGDSTDFLTESTTVLDVLNMFATSSESCTTSYPPCPEGTDPTACPEPVETCEEIDNSTTSADLEEFQQELDQAIDDLITELNEKVFIEENIEEQNEDSVTYLLGPELFCTREVYEQPVPAPDGTSDGATEPPLEPTQEPTEEIDPECAADIESQQIRLRVTSPSEGDVDVDLLLTDERINPVSFQLYQDELGVSTDLAELQQALEKMGEDLEGLQMSGVLQGQLIKNAENDVSLRFNVREDVFVSSETDAGETVTVELGNSSPTAELRLNGNAEELTATYDYGALRVAGPLSAFADVFESGDSSPEIVDYDEFGNPIYAEPEPEPQYTGDIELLVGGYEGSVTFDGSTDRLEFQGLGLGDVSTTLEHDGMQVFALDINEDDDRHFDMSIESGAEDEATIGFDPGLDINLNLAFQTLADQIEVPEYMLDDTLRIWLDGDNPTIVARDSGLEVLSGAMHLSSSATPSANIDVDAGMCLLEVETSTETGATETELAHELLSQFEAGSCQ